MKNVFVADKNCSYLKGVAIFCACIGVVLLIVEHSSYTAAFLVSSLIFGFAYLRRPKITVGTEGFSIRAPFVSKTISKEVTVILKLMSTVAPTPGTVGTFGLQIQPLLVIVDNQGKYLYKQVLLKGMGWTREELTGLIESINSNNLNNITIDQTFSKWIYENKRDNLERLYGFGEKQPIKSS